jgi:hypothetical protein
MARAFQKNNLSKVLILLGIFVASTIVVIKNPKKLWFQINRKIIGDQVHKIDIFCSSQKCQNLVFDAIL